MCRTASAPPSPCAAVIHPQCALLSTLFQRYHHQAQLLVQRLGFSPRGCPPTSKLCMQGFNRAMQLLHHAAFCLLSGLQHCLVLCGLLLQPPPQVLHPPLKLLPLCDADVCTTVQTTDTLGRYSSSTYNTPALKTGCHYKGCRSNLMGPPGRSCSQLAARHICPCSFLPQHTPAWGT